MPHHPFFVNSKHFQPVPRYQINFGLIRRKIPSAHLPLLQFFHCGFHRSLGLNCLFLTFSSFFSVPGWKEVGIGAAKRLGPTRCDWPLGESSLGTLCWNLQAPKLRSRGASLGRAEGREGAGSSDLYKGLSLQDTNSLSELHQPSLPGWILCELPHCPSLTPNHKFSPA